MNIDNLVSYRVTNQGHLIKSKCFTLHLLHSVCFSFPSKLFKLPYLLLLYSALITLNKLLFGPSGPRTLRFSFGLLRRRQITYERCSYIIYGRIHNSKPSVRLFSEWMRLKIKVNNNAKWIWTR